MVWSKLGSKTGSTSTTTANDSHPFIHPSIDNESLIRRATKDGRAVVHGRDDIRLNGHGFVPLEIEPSSRFEHLQAKTCWRGSSLCVCMCDSG